jgi:hypothetical protein
MVINYSLLPPYMAKSRQFLESRHDFLVKVRKVSYLINVTL